MSFDLRKSKSFQRAQPLTGPALVQPENRQEDEIYPQQDAGKILHQWRAPEFEVYEKSTRWYVVFAVFILALVAYALANNGPIMAITFILIGIMGFIYLQKDPRVITFSVTSKGVIADKEMYLYENIHSFWIFYDEPHTKTISLHTKASMLPFIHIPLKNEDPVHLRTLLLQNIPEIKQDPGLVDAIERVLHI